MKKYVCLLLVAAMILGLLAGCGSRKEAQVPEPTEPEIEETQTELEKRMDQENQVDDSSAFSREDPHNDGYGPLVDYMAAKVFPEYVKTWTENGEYVKSSLSFQSHPEGGDTLMGWVLFRGTPKPETGWQSVDGKDLYCRFFTGSTQDRTHFTLEKSQPGIPLDPLNTRTFFGSPNGIYGLNGEPKISGRLKLKTAELYIRSLGKSFVLTDLEKLQRLGDALQPIEWGKPVSHRCEGFNPMVITLEDGSQFLIETMDDGFPWVDAWSGNVLELNLWQLFGVPGTAAGFAVDEKGNTVLTLERVQKTYAPDGRILRMAENKELEDGQTHTVLREYTYDEALHLVSVTVFDGDRVVFNNTYEYDDRGLLIRESTYSEGVLGWYFTYEYDTQDRVIAEIWHGADGRTGHNTSNNYYWYDEEGSQYAYGMLDDGTVNSGKAPPDYVRKNP